VGDPRRTQDKLAQKGLTAEQLDRVTRLNALATCPRLG
jgi:hypothetical protein